MQGRWKRLIASGLVAGVLAGGVQMAGIGAAGASNIGNEGCTPGYWKSHTTNWEEYAPTTTIGNVFTIPASLASYSNTTFLQGLKLQGGDTLNGSAEILLRASVAAFLNAAHESVGYPYRRFDDPGNLLDTINAALASGDRQTMIDLATWLDDANNLGCPL